MALLPTTGRLSPVSRAISPRADATSLWVSLGALLATAAVAAALVLDTKIGVLVLLGMCFVPIALWRLPLAICAWAVLVFLSSTSTLGAYPNRVLLFLGLCWIGLLIGGRTNAREALRSGYLVLALATIFLSWVLLTLAWAPVPGAVGTQVKLLLYGGFSLLLLLGAIVERSHVRWLAAAFVLGATVSVLWGAAKGGLGVGTGVASEVADAGGRFEGGAGDPNYLAAVLVPALMLIAGLAARRGAGQRLLLALAAVIVAIGLAASESRGGVVAISVCAVVALVIWRGRRAFIGALIALIAACGAIFFLLKPTAWSRILESNQGSGRVDIWTVAWRIVQGHPFVGIGFGQFPQVSVHYVLQPGALEYIGLLIEKQLVVHNLYLQIWVEQGIVGLLLFLAVVAVSLGNGWLAVRRFDAQGDGEMSALARAAVLALIGMLAASFFLSDLENGQLWILLALGPVLAGVARRQDRMNVRQDRMNVRPHLSGLSSALPRSMHQ